MGKVLRYEKGREKRERWRSSRSTSRAWSQSRRREENRGQRGIENHKAVHSACRHLPEVKWFMQKEKKEETESEREGKRGNEGTDVGEKGREMEAKEN